MDARYPRTAFVFALVLSGGIAAADNAETAHDPYEGYNRAMFAFNQKADRYLMQPVARGYRAVTPQPARNAVSNFFNNFRDMVSFGSNVLRGDAEKAGTDFMRVAVNSTFGLGGLIDMAGYAGMPSNKNNLGDTFASWGWKKSHYFVVPFLGPSTVRDTLGSTITSIYSPTGFIHDKPFHYASTALNAVNRREQLLDVTDAFENMRTGDDYTYLRDFYLTARNKQIGNASKLENVDDLLDMEHAGETETPETDNGFRQPENPAEAAPDPSIQSFLPLAPALQSAWQKSDTASAELSH